jgi:uncharacterized damage-inducible protein DinB
MMTLAYVAAILDRDLRTLGREVEAYPADADLWATRPGIKNVGGTLVLHLAGNLQHYIGARLGGTGYVRDRAAEFARRDVLRAELLREIEAARVAVRATLSGPRAPDLAADFPERVAGKTVNNGEYLMHLTTHFAYHLGQVDYHRRMVTGNDAAVDAMQPAELSTAR